MKKKSITGFAILMFMCLLIVILGIKRNQVEDTKEQSSPVSKELRNIELLAIMENEEAKKDSESSLTSTEELPDYTKMFPDLYTVFAIPKEMEQDKKIAYLTFDDGPSENTFDILDTLEELDIKATFFLVGSSISVEEEDCLKRMINEGHTIGIHTYSHLCNEIYCSVERFLDDFNTVYQQIYDITGERVNIYRFPWGSNNNYSKGIKDALMEEMERRGFSCYDWNVDSNDSIGKPTSYSIRRNIKKDLGRQDYPIILMHDAGVNDLTAQILPEIIQMISDQGFKFDTLDHREPYQFNW
ncbi:MAG: polysaccharide deacetylase family protein [Mobilitalea sp.]